MRKIIFLMVALLLILSGNVYSAEKAWRYKDHATDCTALTGGKESDLCYQESTQEIYKCVPTSGDCDTVGEWKKVSSGLSGVIQIENGGTGLSTAADDTTLVSNGSAFVAKTLPTCTDTGGNHLNYNDSTNSFICGTSGGGGGVAGSNTQVQFNDGGSMAGNAGLVFDKNTGILTATSYASAASTDPYSIYDVSSATDFDYWFGVSSNNNNVADTSDVFQFGTGTTPFSNINFQILPGGDLTMGDDTSSTLSLKYTGGGTTDYQCDVTSLTTTVKNRCYNLSNDAAGAKTVLDGVEGTFTGVTATGSVDLIMGRAKLTNSGTVTDSTSRSIAFQGYNLNTNTSSTITNAIGVHGYVERNGAGGTTASAYGGFFDKATVTAGTLTNDYALGLNGRMRVVSDPRTIADSGGAGTATLTLAPTSSNVELTCSDADGCDITMSETGVLDGTIIRIVNVSANACNFADTGGVSELAGTFAMGQYDSLSLEYVVNTWVEIARSNN